MDELFSFPNTEIALKEYADFIVNTYKDNLEKNGHKASGKLISGIHSVININGQAMSVDLYMEDYWKWVERGRMAGKRPPMESILNWIKLKHIVPRPDENGKLPTEKQLAFLIARSIGENGAPCVDKIPVEATHDLADSKQTTDEFYWARIEEAITKDLYDHYRSIVSMLIV